MLPLLSLMPAGVGTGSSGIPNGSSAFCRVLVFKLISAMSIGVRWNWLINLASAVSVVAFALKVLSSIKYKP